jgi:tetratricopeptide (TPR) repeat protein
VRDVSHEARELTQRGLEHYARGRFREAVLAWQDAANLAPHDPQARSLLAFARRKLRERDTRPIAHSHSDTLESPIPGFLAGLTAVEADDCAGNRPQETSADGEWAQIDTRRVLAGADDGAAPGTVRELQDAGDTWKELPIQDDKLAAGARGLVDECQAALKAGRADNAALAAEMALQLCEQARSPEVDGIVDPTRPLFERAFCACIGDIKCAPIRAIPSEELAAHGLDHRAAFLMSRMDGMLTVGDLLDIAGMPRFDALRLVAALRRAQAVDMVPVG